MPPVLPAEFFDRGYIAAKLESVMVDVALGLHPWEQHPEHPTKLRVDVVMYRTGQRSEPGEFIDYDPIRLYLKTWSTRPHTPLLETLAEDLIDQIFKLKLVEACWVSLVKPHIFPEASGAGIEIFRVRPK